MVIASTPERQAPQTTREAEPSHLARYVFAATLVQSSDAVLDVPCGTGYGSSILSEKAKSVCGVDVFDGAITHANECFKKENNRFIVADATNLRAELTDQSFDRIVSFEGIEHLNDQRAFLSEMRRLLAPQGRLIISTPRKPHGSPFHTVEFSRSEFEMLLGEYVQIEAMYGQIFTDIFDLSVRSVDPDAYHRFNFIAVCKHR